MKFHISFLIMLFSLATSCRESNNTQKTSKFTKLTTQYLLTNEIRMKDREVVFGGSAYLIEMNKETYLCTAKHLTGPAMGFEPAIDLKSFKDSVLHWKAYPRNNKLSNDTLVVNELLFFDDNNDDLILLSLKTNPTKVGVLSPNFDKLEKGRRFRILACEYRDDDCFQKEYFGTFNGYTNTNQLEITMEASKLSIAGFSGAPILDENNKVVGHVLAGGDAGNGKINVYAAPIILANKIIKK